MQSKTQMLEHKANTVKEHAAPLRSNARMEIAQCKKKNKKWQNIQQIFIHQALQSKEGILPIQTVQTQNKCLFIQLGKRQPGVALYSKVIFWVKLSCVTHFKPLISAYLTTVGQNALKYTLNHSVGSESAVHRCSVLLGFSSEHISVNVSFAIKTIKFSTNKVLPFHMAVSWKERLCMTVHLQATTWPSLMVLHSPAI